jgi:hypothetical protein
LKPLPLETVSSENICSSSGDAQEKTKEGVKNRMKLNSAPKMEILVQKLELVTDDDDSPCSSQRYGIMILQKLPIKWIIDRHAIAK